VPERGLVEVVSTLLEGCLGATIGDGSTPGAEAVLGALIGDGSSSASSLEVTEAVLSEGCLGAKIGDGSSPARSLEVTKAVLGASEYGCPVKVGSSPVAVVSKDPEPSILVNAQTTSVVPVSAQTTSSIPSPASSSLVSKVLVKIKGSSGSENSMIRRDFFGPSSAELCFSQDSELSSKSFGGFCVLVAIGVFPACEGEGC
jgi:hypothetical protein